ncbi:hypothetical protein OAT67_09820 [Bacteriovoracaceae bacterium]|nr:hypothetical protein [Bacteriovoracaceae bacterium]|tara:strand:- start:68242 stop:68526 length:285 start_codon:yes stop_codon:yes gene_type:complete
MKVIIASMLILSSVFTMANTAQVTSNQTINISGEFEQKPLTPAQKLKLIRKKLEKQNELLVKKKIEMMRYQQEVMLMKKMQTVFDDQMQKIENL